jgi:glycosyltransferase involved in cell wall biosynthesis
MKTLIIHDRFMFRGGAERLVLILANDYNADILTEFWIDGETFDRSEAPGKIFTLAKNDLKIDAARYFRAQYNFIFKTRKIIRQGGYDLIIFSGNNCLSAIMHLEKGQRNFLYCHSPVRHVYDLYKKFRGEQKSLFKRIVYYSIGAWLIRFIYRIGLSGFKTVVSNSNNTRSRLIKYCRKDSQAVIWPPVDVNKFKWISQENYYLSFGRVDKLKRVGDIVKAFQKMPDKKLKVSSSGNDFENVKNLARGYDNIEIIGWVSDEDLKELVGKCIATIYVPIDEDAGMAPLESNSAGKPCICNRDGGFVEIIEDGVNGKFVPKDYSIDDIVLAVKELDKEKALATREACEGKAKEYSKEEFLGKVRGVVEGL